ncbi:MAG TPA: HpaII family restriction endonuclease [Paludibacter sp.]|jgi:hypothetical protein|nr:HpaII family restriction endonuclease [Paludibacter sp.]HPM09444.1 HpaII family restriction endonuclease [Paludibacter sp.]
MLTGNKGEWSEIYALLKIIADKQLFAGDSNLNKIENLIYPIIKVLRDESNGTFEFSYDNDLVVIKNPGEEIRISINEFQKQAYFLLTKLKEKTDTTFSIPETEDFINSYNSNSLRAQSSVKTDIKVVIHDYRTGTAPELGFSIKSQLGDASTLLNAGRTTNFIYKINGLKLSAKQISTINAIDTRSKIRDRVKEINKLGGKFQFESPESPIFENNLVLVDSALPKIISEILLLYYSSNYSKVSDLVSEISKTNPLKFNIENNHPFYSYKIKRLLTDIALGMMPSIVWTGELDATGGYLVVKNSGDILCYHIYNRNEFEDYLFANTKLETAGSTRHQFGTIYEKNGSICFKLNLQIRFI